MSISLKKSGMLKLGLSLVAMTVAGQDTATIEHLVGPLLSAVIVTGVVGAVTTTFVSESPSVLAAAVNVATIVVEAPTGSGPMSAQFSVPSLALSSDAGSEET